jgi:hypothetical protein
MRGVIETFLPFCAAGLCRHPDTDTWLSRMRGTLRDVAVAVLHLVVPEDLHAALPSFSNPALLLPPRKFGDESAAEIQRRVAKVRGRKTALLERRETFERWLAMIQPGARPGLHYLHILLPHGPWTYLPSGRACSLPASGGIEWPPDAFTAAAGYQRYLGQTAYVDLLIGRLVAHLKSAGLWDQTLLVLVADHGVSFRAGHPMRAATETTKCDIMAVPLFVKLPGQTTGGVTDLNVETIDVLPTIADVLGIKVPWRMDGLSLRTAMGRPMKVLTGPNWDPERLYFGRRPNVVLPPNFQPGCLDVPTKRALFVPGGPAGDWLLRVGPYADIVGKRADAFPRSEASAYRITSDDTVLDLDVEPGAETIPCSIVGTIEGAPEGRVHPDLAIAVDGTIVAVARAFSTKPKGMQFDVFVPEVVLKPGRNVTELFTVSGPPTAPVLAPMSRAEAPRP